METSEALPQMRLLAPNPASVLIMRPFDDTPFNRAMHFRLAEHESESASIAVSIDPWFEQENGVVHGAIIASAADTAAVYAVRSRLEPGEQMTGVEFKINFLRPATLDGGELTAQAHVVKRGRTIAVCDVEVLQAGRAIAAGLFTYLLIR